MEEESWQQDKIKKCYKLIAVDLSTQKELDADQKEIQLIIIAPIIGQLLNPAHENVTDKPMSYLTNFNREMRLQFLQ